MALRPEVKELIHFLVELWVKDIVTEVHEVQHRVIAESATPPDMRQPERTQAMLTTREAAQYVRLSTSTLNQLRVKGGGPPFIKLGRRVTYRVTALDAWLSKREFPHTSAVDVARNASRLPRRVRRT